MDMLLLTVTVVSLVVAFVMCAVAWRLARVERARGAARVAALTQAASEPETVVRQAPRPAPVASPAIDAATELLTVGEARGVAPWGSPRMSTFAASGRAAAVAREPEVRSRPVVASESAAVSTAFGDGFLGGSPSNPPGNDRQRGLAVAAAIVFAAVIGGGYWTVYGGKTGASAPVAADRSPLELVSLRHERREGRLAVTGLVRNPVAGAPVDKVTAVVFLFDQQGAFLSSARADVDFLRLAPGDESPFVVALDAPAAVARYRVSFRTDAGVIPHIDRRGQEPIAPIAVSANTVK